MIYKLYIIATTVTKNDNEDIITDLIAITLEICDLPLVFIQELLQFEINIIIFKIEAYFFKTILKITKIKCTCWFFWH